MNKTKLSLYIIILLLTAAALFCFVHFSDGLFEINDANVTKKELATVETNLISNDTTLFWIGEVPSSFEGSAIEIIKSEPGSVDGSVLPFENYTVKQDIPLGEGKFEHVRKTVHGYCPLNSFIIINNVSDLSSEEYDLIIECLNSNQNVKLVILGNEAVSAFREHICLPTGAGNEYFSMKYSAKTGSNISCVDELKGVDATTKSWYSLFINNLAGDIVVKETEEAGEL